MDRVTDYLEAALEPIERERFEAHCRSCAACRAVLAENRRLVESLGGLSRSAGISAPRQDELLDLFRRHRPHGGGPRLRTESLGLGRALVAPGDHLAYFWETSDEFDAASGFLATGIEQGDTCILLGHDEANSRLRGVLERRGMDVASLRRKGVLRSATGADSAKALLEELAEQIKGAVDRGERLVRILGNLGWGRPGWPDDRELVCLESRVTAAIQDLPAVVMCSYDVHRTPGLPLLVAGLECHPWTFRRGVLRSNEHFVPGDRLSY